MVSASNVAKYILSLSDPDEGDIISPLKLQKLLYYAQGFSLAIYDRAIFSEDVMAWNHGPVVREVYREYRDYGSAHIPPPEDYDPEDILSTEEQELLNDVYTAYGQYSAWRLSAMTHEEPPWRDTERDFTISHDKLKEYFKTRIEDE